MRVKLLADMGAYLQLNGPGIPLLGAFMYPGVYTFDAYSFECTGVFTNKTPTDAYRGAGRPEAAFAIERIMDALAREIGHRPGRGTSPQLLRAVRRADRHPGRHPVRLDEHASRRWTGCLELADYEALARGTTPAGARRAIPSSSASGSRRTPRSAASPPPRCSLRCAPAAPAGRRRRSRCSPRARSRSSRAPRRTARAT